MYAPPGVVCPMIASSCDCVDFLQAGRVAKKGTLVHRLGFEVDPNMGCGNEAEHGRA